MTPLNKNVAICLVYLMAGFDSERRIHHGTDVEATYNYHADLHGGHIGIVSDLVDYAEFIETYLDGQYNEAEYHGVIQYEVYESLGQWIFSYPDAPLSEFQDVAMSVIDDWFNANQATSGLTTTAE